MKEENMSLNDFASIAAIVQGIFVIVSLGFVWYQLRETVRHARAANSQRLMELSSPFNLLLMQNRDMEKLWIDGAKEYDKMDAIDRRRYYQLLIWWLALHENIYHQWRAKLIDTETFTAWSHVLEEFVDEQQLGRYWDQMKGVFEPSFVTHVSQIIMSQPTKGGNLPGGN
jgi:hypothetical protein